MRAKTIKEKLDESISMGGHHFDVLKINNEKVKAGKEGILGDNRELISWNTIKILLDRYA